MTPPGGRARTSAGIHHFKRAHAHAHTHTHDAVRGHPRARAAWRGQLHIHTHTFPFSTHTRTRTPPSRSEDFFPPWSLLQGHYASQQSTPCDAESDGPPTNYGRKTRMYEHLLFVNVAQWKVVNCLPYSLCAFPFNAFYLLFLILIFISTIIFILDFLL